MDMIVKTKTCKKCYIKKPLTDFHRKKNSRDGHRHECKICIKAYQAQPHIREIKKAASRKYYKTDKGRENEKKAAKKRNARVKDLTRDKVYYQVRRALHYGVLTKQPCEVCGNENSQAHHHDYEKPLDVNWLCQRCHGREHVGLSFLTATMDTLMNSCP